MAFTQLIWLNRDTESQPSHSLQNCVNKRTFEYICINNPPYKDRQPTANQHREIIKISTQTSKMIKNGTVKPVYNGHSVEKQKVAVVGRWPLYRRSNFNRPFHFFLSYNTFPFRRDYQKHANKGLLSQHEPTLLDCWLKTT